MDSYEESDDDSVESGPLLTNVSEPKDRFYLTYIILCLLGMTTLFPWNFFVTANQYFQYKFRPLHGSTDNTISKMFENYVTLASTIPTTASLLINPFLHKWISQKNRIMFALFVVMVVFLLTAIFVKVDTDSWQYNFFAFTISSVVIMNVANGMFQSCSIGLASLFPPKYMISLLTGQTVAGVLAPLANIFSLMGSPHPTESAVGYFSSALIVLVLALGLYLFFLTLPFAKFYLHKSHFQDSLKSSNTLIQQDDNQILIIHDNKKLSIFQIFKKIWIPALSCAMIFFASLTIYPSVLTFVHSTNEFKNPTPWTGIFFTPVCCFLLYNLSDLIGRTICGQILWPPENHDVFHLILSLLRFIFLPLFLLCNIQPPGRLPVLFNNDAYFVFFVVMFGLSNGYLCGLIMMFAPKKVSEVNQELAGTILAALLSFGILGGSFTSLAVVALMQK